MYRLNIDKKHRRMSGLVVCLICFTYACYSKTAYSDRPEGISPQTIRGQSGPASLKGLGESFSPNISTGTGNYAVPIQVAPGPLTPSVSLVYAGGNGKGALGMGFRLPLLHIYRTTDKGLPEYKETDGFAVSGPSLNDELVLVNEEAGYYRLKNETAFVLFIRDAESDSWTLRFPDGNTAVLGATGQSRQVSSGRPFKWFVERYTDLFGREIYYEYMTDAGYVYVTAINYQLHRDDAYSNRVLFYYEDRPYPFTDYTYGTEVTCAKRLQRIDVYHQERRLRRYQLSYENDKVFSVLHQIVMEGESGEVMPTLTFDYLHQSKQSGEYVKMVWLPPLEGLVSGASELEDVNGDGLPDLLVGVGNEYRYYENLDGRKWSKTAVPLANSPDESLGQGGALLADINGDGFRDVVFKRDGDFWYYPAGHIESGVFQGYGAAIRLENSSGSGLDFSSADVKMSDLNGDGRVDMLWQKPGQDSIVVNDRNDVLREVNNAELPVDVDFDNPEVQMHDFNGDGVLDFVLKNIDQDTGRIRVWYGEGSGRYRQEQEMLGVPKGGRSSEYHLVDVNKDGQTDIVRGSGTWVTYYLNRGDGSFTGMAGSFDAMPPESDTRRLLFADMNGNGTTDVIWLTMDWQLKYLDLMGEAYMGMLSRVDNGMGWVTEMSYRSSTAYAIEAKERREPWKTPMPNPVPVISRIYTTDSLDVLGVEATESLTTFDYRDGYWDGKEREFRGFAEVTTTSHGDAFHDTMITETHMHVGRNLETGEDEEVLKGNPWMVLTRDGSGRLLASVETQWEQRWLCQEDVSDAGLQILPRCADYSDKQKHKDDLVAIGLKKEALNGTWEGTATPRWTATKDIYNAWGAVIRGEKYGEVLFSGGRQPGSPFDISDADVAVGEDEIITETDYIYDVANWRVGVAMETRTFDLAGSLEASSRTYYDGAPFEGLPLGQLSLELPSRRSVWLKEEDRWIDAKRMQYNADGLVETTMDANDNIVTLAYDEVTRSLPVAETFEVESGLLRFEAAYDTGMGSLIWATDLDGNETHFFYDGLGRVTHIVDPLSTETEPTIEYEYEYGTPVHPVSTTITRMLVDRAANQYREAIQYSDGAGRARLTKREAEDAFGYIASGWTRMTSRGAASHVYDSFATRSPEFEAAPASSPVTITQYDALSRAVTVTPPAVPEYGPTYSATEYRPFETWVYDEQDSYDESWQYPAVTKVDGLGRIREVLKHNDVNGQLTELVWRTSYDTAGNITEHTDPENNTRFYQYDSLNRLTHLDDLSVGTIDYTYDDAGNLLTRTDALGQAQHFVYGKANRLQLAHMTNDAHGRSDYSYQYSYDTPSDLLPEGRNLSGRLSKVEWPTGTAQVSYDALGRLETEAQTLWDGVSDPEFQQRDRYVQRFEYNAAGELTSQAAPGGLSVQFSYNQRSLLSQVSAGFDGSIGELFGGMTYDHRGALEKTDARNGVRACSWYDDRARLEGMMTGRIEDVSCTANPSAANGSAYQQLIYTRTPTGLIKSIVDLSPVTPGVPDFSATYEYDRLYQLKNAATADGLLTYNYDTIQNLVERTFTHPEGGENIEYSNLAVGTFGYGENGASPNQITSAGDQTFEYNAVGQMAEYNGFALQFDIEGRLVEAYKPDYATIEYFYDDTGEKKLAIITKPNHAPKVYRYISDGYQIRNGTETWFISGGHGQAEVSKASGLEIDLTLLEELTAYVADPENSKKPMPAEYMDLDGDGDEYFDEADLAIAENGFWNETSVGGEALVWRFYQKDHLGGNTLVTDSAGDVVSTMQYHPYGGEKIRSGQRPIFGFAGGEIEEEVALGLIRFGARWYAPDIGRWVSGDVYIGESANAMLAKPLESNLYSYALNNPVANIDPSGQTPPDVPANVDETSGMSEDQLRERIHELQTGIDEINRDLASYDNYRADLDQLRANGDLEEDYYNNEIQSINELYWKKVGRRMGYEKRLDHAEQVLDYEFNIKVGEVGGKFISAQGQGSYDKQKTDVYIERISDIPNSGALAVPTVVVNACSNDTSMEETMKRWENAKIMNQIMENGAAPFSRIPLVKVGNFDVGPTQEYVDMIDAQRASIPVRTLPRKSQRPPAVSDRRARERAAAKMRAAQRKARKGK